ncbi:MAG TPA: GMC family oxidoreductase [bacterium]|nr:GMC family oxidoreductase [bacterium]
MKPPREFMRRHQGPVDVCIVGAGAAGSTLAKELAEGGLKVVVLEAGPWLDTQEDFLNDELAMLGRLDWEDPRVCDGGDPIPAGRPNTGKGVGGSTIHFTAMKLRLHPEDFKLKSTEGVGEDWPFTYEELAPYYERAEDFVGVSGPRDMPWPGNRESYPQGELPMNAGDQVIAKGFEGLGMRWRMTPHAILTGPKGDRSPCMYYGFCMNGCKSDAKGSALVTWVPAAVKAGAEFRERCYVTRIECDAQGRARRVLYMHEGREYAQEAELIIVSGYSIESPRLLLNSACAPHPQGLANSSGLVGRYLQVHPATIAYGHFPDPLDNFISPPVGIMTQDPYGTQAGRDFIRGYMQNRYAYFPIDFITTLIDDNPNLWGEELFRLMDTYTHWTILTSMNEQLPDPNNRVGLAPELKDDYGLPVAHVTMTFSDNDHRMLAHARDLNERVLRAAGADQVLHAKSAYHVLGTCRMGTDPGASVVDPFCRSHDIPNLFVCDGSVFVTQGAVNPSLTIEAIALRTAEHILRAGPTPPPQ